MSAYDAKSNQSDRAYVDKTLKFAAVICTIVFVTGYVFIPSPIPHLVGASERLMYTLRLQAPALWLIVAMAGAVALKRRTTSTINPLDAESRHLVEVDNNVLRNTVEQFLTNAGLQLILSTYLTPGTMHVIPTLAGMFVVGRVLFWAGYRRSPIERALGLGITVLPTMVLCVVTAVCMIVQGPANGFGK
jgi:hypothetical protein